MYPTIESGQLGLAFAWAYIFRKPNIGDLVIALDPLQPKRKIIKRVYKITKENIWLKGDNLCSYNKILVKKVNILGKVIWPKLL